jgi:hypothetical protein
MLAIKRISVNALRDMIIILNISTVNENRRTYSYCRNKERRSCFNAKFFKAVRKWRAMETFGDENVDILCS